MESLGQCPCHRAGLGINWLQWLLCNMHVSLLVQVRASSENKMAAKLCMERVVTRNLKVHLIWSYDMTGFVDPGSPFYSYVPITKQDHCFVAPHRNIQHFSSKILEDILMFSRKSLSNVFAKLLLEEAGAISPAKYWLSTIWSLKLQHYMKLGHSVIFSRMKGIIFLPGVFNSLPFLLSLSLPIIILKDRSSLMHS